TLVSISVTAYNGRREPLTYKPWLRVQDVPSRGRSRKVHGLKTGRIHHVLSDLEYAYLLALEFSERVVDIREQFPLFPIAPIQECARRHNIRYPRYAGTQVPYVMTTDFVVSLRTDDGSLREFARTVKYEDELSPGRSLTRTLEKLELERSYWMARDIDWKIVTQRSVAPALARNLIWLYAGAQVEGGLQASDLQARFVECLDEAGTHDRTLSSLLRAVSYRLNLAYSDAVRLFKHLVWNKVILVDLSTPMLLTSQAPTLRVLPADASSVKRAA
ncbi:TnsA endonuclease N-terminal domain-containing protein, partial [Paraburkholderia madseniana]|uniref:TnsA endonuclease N-terminal domain-containing protein n=1 Tax=Paraburkholderia TaxID=1822464 RepID=UPI0027DF4870